MRASPQVSLLLRRALSGVFLAIGTAPVAQAQAWSLILFVDPYPSPYPSDWETNPNLSTLTIVNPTGQDRDVRLVYQVVNSAGQVLANGRSDLLNIPAGAPTIFTSYIDIAGSSSRDRATQARIERTGRIPEGTYRACVTMADAGGFVLGDACAMFTIVYPDPPFLLGPGAGEVVSVAAPFFLWTPVQVPPAFEVRYALQIAAVRPSQTPEEALNAAVLHFQGADLEVTNLQYPVDGQPFEPGTRYAWRVVAVDQGGFPPSSNGGSSEIRTFRYDDGTAATSAAAPLKLSLFNAQDTEADSGTPPESRGIKEICEQWDSLSAKDLVLTVNSPLGLKRFAGQPAWLFRQGDPAESDAKFSDRGDARWWIRVKTSGGRRDVLIGGSCNKTKTKVDWIASRDSTLQQRFNELVQPSSSGEGNETKVVKPETGVLDYAVVVLSGPGQHTVAVPEEFHEGVDFFKGHNQGIEVALGLNVYAVLNLPALKAWQFFQALDYPERQVTLQGFLGWDAQWNLGLALGDEAGVDVSNEKKFLVLRADLPERKPRSDVKNPWYQSMHLSFEFSVGDSTGFSGKSSAIPEAQRTEAESGRLNVKNSFDVVGKLIHTIVINKQLTLEGSVGFDRATEGGKGAIGKVINLVQSWREAACPMPTETSTDLVVSYAAQTDVPLGTNLTWEGLKADFKLTQKRDKFVVALSSSLGIGGRPAVIKLGGSMEQQIDKATSKKDVKVLEAEQNQLKKDLAATRLGLEDAKKEWKEATGAKKAVSYDAYCAESAKVTKLSQDLETMTKDARTWRFRASAGHMSFGELLASLQDLVAWIGQR